MSEVMLLDFWMCVRSLCCPMRLRDPSDVSALKVVVCIDRLLRGSSKNHIPRREHIVFSCNVGG